MEKTLLRLFVFMVLSNCLMSFTSSASQSRKVLIIGIDGCRSDALQQASTPYLDSLISTGLYTYDSWHCGITISGPSWSSIMTGTWWNKHGVKANSYANSSFNSYPYFTKRAKEIKPNLRCVQISEWEALNNFVYNDGMDAKIQTANGGDSTTAEALRQLADTNLDCLFAYYEAVDREGHASTFNPGNALYLTAIEYTDTQVGILLNAVKKRSNYANEDWLILVVTDHGGTGFIHGGNSWAERHIWFIASGNSVTPQQISASDPGTYNFFATGIFNAAGVNKNLMKQSPVHTDVAVTALHHLIYDSGIQPETYAAWKLDGRSWLTNTINVNSISANNHFLVYPNPSHGIFTVKLLNTNSPKQKLFVLDLLGREILQNNISTGTSSFTLDLSKFSPGTYLLKLDDGNKTFVKKIELIQ
jgi:hypothetical protein